MIINLVSGWGTAGPFTEPRSDLGIYFDRVDQYGVDGDFDNPIPTPYLRLITQSGCIGFPQGREWDGTAEDAIRLHALGVTMVESDDFTESEVEGG